MYDTSEGWRGIRPQITEERRRGFIGLFEESLGARLAGLVVSARR
jgi:hypothetical protein